MELTSDEKKIICEEYDTILDKKHHVTEYLPKSYSSKIEIPTSELTESTKAKRAIRAKGIASKISAQNPDLEYKDIYNYIINPDFSLETELPNNSLDIGHPTLEDTLLVKKVEEEYVIQGESTFKIKGLIFNHAANMFPISRIRRIKFANNLFCIIIDQKLFLKDAYEFYEEEIDGMTYKEIKELWNQIIDENMAYEPVEGRIIKVFTSQEEFEEYTQNEFGYTVKEENWHPKGKIYLDNRYQKETKNSDKTPRERIRTLVKQRKYNKKA